MKVLFALRQVALQYITAADGDECSARIRDMVDREAVIG
jgi:hypothetical protein